MAIRVGMINSSINMLDHYVAVAKGHYRDQGLDVELVTSPGEQVADLLASGELTATSTPVVESILKDGAPLRYLLFTRNGPPHYIMARPGINTVRDLAGKTVQAGSALATYHLALDWLKESRVQPGTDVRVRRGPAVAPGFFSARGLPDWAVVLLSGGEIVQGGVDDAFMAHVLERALLMEEAGYSCLVDLAQAYPGRLVHGLATHVETIRQHPEVIQALVNAHIAAARTIQEERVFCTALITEKWGVSERVAREAWEILHSTFIADLGAQWLAPQIEYFARVLREQNPGLAIALAPAESYIDATFFEAARATAAPALEGPAGEPLPIASEPETRPEEEVEEGAEGEPVPGEEPAPVAGRILLRHSDWFYGAYPVEINGQWAIISASDDHIVRAWDWATGREMKRFPGHGGVVNSAVPVHMDNRWVIVSASRDQTVRIWDWTTREELKRFAGQDGVRFADLVKVEGRWLILSASRDQFVRLWDWSSGREVRRFRHDDGVSSVAMVQLDGQWVVVSASRDQTVRLWDWAGNKELRRFGGHTHWVFSATPVQIDGNWFIISAGADQSIRVWDCSTGRLAKQFPGHSDWVNSALPAQMDGRWVIVSGSRDRTIRLWDWVSRREIARLSGHTDWITSAHPAHIDGQWEIGRAHV